MKASELSLKNQAGRQDAKAANPRAVLGLLAGAAFWGVVWYPYRLFSEAGMSGAVSLLITYLVAVLLGLFFLRDGVAELRRGGRSLLFIALAAGWANLGYVLAVIEGEVMRVLLLFYLAPLWTVLLARLMLGERPNRVGYAVIALSVAGAMVMLWPPGGGLPIPAVVAEWVGLTAGMSFALTNVLSRHAQHHSIPAKSLAVWIGVALLCLVPLVFHPAQAAAVAELPSRMWWLLFGVGGLLFAVNLAVQYGLTHTPANRAIVIFLSELVFAAISAWLLAGEIMGVQEWLGGAMIVAASLFSTKLEAAPREG